MHAKDIAAALAARAESVAEMLLPGGKRKGGEWEAGSVAGDAGQSLKVRLTGGKAGVWKDFATGQGGDLLDLWCAVRGCDFVGAIDGAREYLGITEQPKFVATRKAAYRRPEKPNCGRPKGAVLTYLTRDRGLTAETLAAFKVAAGADDDEIVFPYLRDGDLINVKYLGLLRDASGKKRIRQEKDAEPCLWGWQALSPQARTVVIAEGEIDAMTLHQCGVPALSVNAGAGNHQWIESDYDRLARFSEILVCFDADDAGKKGAAEVAQRLGLDRVRIVNLPHKDPNECLTQHGWDARCFADAISMARPLDPAELKPATDWTQAMVDVFCGQDDPNTAGLPLTVGATGGWMRFRPDELTIWTGINGHYKSMVLGQVCLSIIEAGERVCIFSGELHPKRLLKRLMIQAGCTGEPSPGFLRAIADWWADGLWIYNHQGDVDRARLLEVFSYAAQRYGIRHFVIDSLLKIDIAEDDYQGQKAFVSSLCDFKGRYQAHVHLVAHPRKGRDETEAPGKLDIAGGKSIPSLADNIISVWRDKAAQEEESPNPDVILSVDKHRNGEREGKIPGWFDQKSLQVCNSNNRRPHQFVSWTRIEQRGAPSGEQ